MKMPLAIILTIGSFGLGATFPGFLPKNSAVTTASERDAGSERKARAHTTHTPERSDAQLGASGKTKLARARVTGSQFLATIEEGDQPKAPRRARGESSGAK